METKEIKLELYKSLIQAINELENPTNSVDNKFFKSKYVPLANILDIIKPVFKNHGLAVFQTPFVMYETVQNVNNSGQTYYSEIGVVKITTTIIHVSGESLDFPPMIFKAQGNTPQNIGSTITYARRYSLSSILGIAGKEDDDDDGNEASNIQYMQNGQGQQYPRQPQYNNQNQQQFQQNVQQNYQQNNKPNMQPKQEQQPTQPKAETNIENPVKVNATVTKKEQSKSGKGTPYVELTLEKDGQFTTAIAKDEKVFEIAKGLEDNSKAVFNLITANGMTFVTNIEVQGANA